jgi:hypothetical protein
LRLDFAASPESLVSAAIRSTGTDATLTESSPDGLARQPLVGESVMLSAGACTRRFTPGGAADDSITVSSSFLDTVFSISVDSFLRIAHLPSLPKSMKRNQFRQEIER